MDQTANEKTDRPCAGETARAEQLSSTKQKTPPMALTAHCSDVPSGAGAVSTCCGPAGRSKARRFGSAGTLQLGEIANAKKARVFSGALESAATVDTHTASSMEEKKLQLYFNDVFQEPVQVSGDESSEPIWRDF